MRWADAARRWTPAVVLGLGCLLLLGARRQTALPLAVPLEQEIPTRLLGYESMDLRISDVEQQVAGMDDYLLRRFGTEGEPYRFSVYVGYYEAQVQGKSIHSPKNCLPGAKWEPIASETRSVNIDGQPQRLNRYLLANRGARVVVYYWYQGRGRVAWNEYAVKWELMRDKARYGRSEEALVRIVIPLTEEVTETVADAEAEALALALIPRVFAALPAPPEPSAQVSARR